MIAFTSEDMESYERGGYLKIERVFTPDDVSKIQQAYRECVKNALEGVKIIYEDDRITVRSIMGYHQSHPILAQYTRDQMVMQIVSKIIQAPVYVSQSKINPKAPTNNNLVSGKKWAYHRDFAFWNILDGMPKASMVSVFVYLTDQTEENGALYVLKGSHKNVTTDSIKSEIGFEEKGTGKRSDDTSERLSLQILSEKLEEYCQRYEQVILSGHSGDLIIMDPRLLHASGDNNTNSSRDIMITVYNPIDNIPEHPRGESFLCYPDHKAISAWTAS